MTQWTETHWVGLTDDERGIIGEQITSRILDACGIFYIPFCLIEDHGAPRWHSPDGEDVVLPDFCVVIGGKQVYLDTKTKTQSILFRKTGEVRHGIDTRLWQQYHVASWLAGASCGLIIVELMDHERNWSGAILVGSIAIDEELRPGCGENTGSMVYWPRSHFLEAYKLSPSELKDVADGQLKLPSVVDVFAAAFGS